MAFLRPVLYGSWSSSCTHRVRIALQLKGIDYEMRPIRREELKHAEFLRVNPSATIPVLVHGKSILSESLSIIEFLDDEYPITKRLFPADVYDKAIARSLALNIVSGIQPFQSKLFIDFIDHKGQKGIEWAQHYINQGFTNLEKRLLRTSGLYCVGDEITIADCCLTPQVYNATAKYKVDLTAFPKIRRINEALEKMPAFQRAHPHCQPDTPPELRVREDKIPKNVVSASAISN